MPSQFVGLDAPLTGEMVLGSQPSTEGMPTPSRQKALAAWRRELGPERVLLSETSIRDYQASTTTVRRRVSAVLRPDTLQQVQSLVRIANRFATPVYPISTGRNWGYGSANPVVDDCAIVDLSGMNRIRDFDAELGLVTVEPGVTQQQLWQYLADKQAPYFVPVHGGGPDCSLLGNALERGYGITPNADHFAALTSLETVLPSGQVYRSALHELGGGNVDQAFKWGLGPYLDGLFTQGNLGIVTQGVIALAPSATQTAGFFFSVSSPWHLRGAIVAVREALRSLGGLVSSINLMNAPRVLSMIEPYPHARVNSGSAMPLELVGELARRHGIASWTGAGALYGEPKLLRAARAVIRRQLRPHVESLVFVDQRRLQGLDWLLRLAPKSSFRRLRTRLTATRQFLHMVGGRPERTALPLAYWKSDRQPTLDESLHPARDRCGLIWYSPLVPMRSEEVEAYVAHVEGVCRKHGMDSLITLTSLSPRVFDSTVPLLFDASDPDATQRAHTCYNELLDTGNRLGFVPYRVGVQHMHRVVDPRATCWHTVDKIKSVLDPNDIIAPGRYAPTQRPLASSTPASAVT